MTSRELYVLLEQLPEESATRRAMRDDEWTTELHLLANVADLLAFFRADWANANGGSQKPEPTPRPALERQRQAEREAAQRAQQSLHDLIHGRIKIAAATRMAPLAPVVDEIH